MSQYHSVRMIKRKILDNGTGVLRHVKRQTQSDVHMNIVRHNSY